MQACIEFGQKDNIYGIRDTLKPKLEYSDHNTHNINFIHAYMYVHLEGCHNLCGGHLMVELVCKYGNIQCKPVFSVNMKTFKKHTQFQKILKPYTFIVHL